MATEEQKLQYTYRANIIINGIDMGALAFLGITEVYDFMTNIYPLKVLMLNINLTETSSKMFLEAENRELKINLSLFEVESSVLPSTDPDYIRNEYVIYTDKEFIGTVDDEYIPLNGKESDAAVENEAVPKEDLMHMVRVYLKEKFPNPFTEDVFNMVTDTATSINDIVVGAFHICANPGLKLSMMKPSNLKTIPANTLMEPMGFLQLLKYLQSTYGMYAYNYSVFILDDVVYIINKEGIPTKNEHDYIINTIPLSAANLTTLGYNSANDNNIINVDASNIIITDVHSEVYTNTVSHIDDSGKLHHPKYKNRNISLVVDNDTLVQTTYNNENIKNKIQDFSVVCHNTYIDITPDMMFQIETNDNLIFSKLAVWGYHRVVTPQGCLINMNLFTRT